MLETCVALDLETTGLSPVADEIIEVGAVKFRGSEVLGSFHTMVNPQRPLPYRIQMLTGIAPAELEAAPPWAVVAGDLAAFIGSQPVVGHSIAFDLGFLSARGMRSDGPAYDTYELACILLPQLRDYSLVSLAVALGLSPGKPHRALGDAHLAREAFLALLERAARLPPPVLSRIVELTRGTDWPLAGVFASVRDGAGSPHYGASYLTQQTPASAGTPLPAIKPAPSAVTPLDMDSLARYLDTEGPLAGTIPGFEKRPGQVEMACAVARTLGSSGQLVVEAGTGVGKSVAYLLPALLFCLQNGCRLAVSTNTINLQEQLTGKDIPDLARALGVFAEGLRVALLKGRSNYLCLRRWQALLSSPGLAREEVRTLLRLLVWLSGTETGDRAEVNLRREELGLWAKTASPREGCPGERCAYAQRDECFLYRARRLAEAAHLLVVNHALLLSDAAANNKVLPEYKYLVIDEAHHLESEATQQFGFVVRQQDMIDYLGRLGATGQRGSGFTGEVERFVHTGGGPLFQPSLRQWSMSAASLVEETRRRAMVFCDVMARFIEEHSSERGSYGRELRLDQGSRVQPAWSEVERVWEGLALALQDVEATLGRLHTILGDMGDATIEAVQSLMLELADLVQAGDELRHRINDIIANPDPGQVYWAARDEANDFFSLHAAPLIVADLLKESLFGDREATVLTSATLTVDGNFNYLKERLGLEDAADLVIGTPFDYQKAALVYVVQDIPEPDRPGYQQALERCLVDLGRALKGRTLVLFTSNSSLRAAHAAIAPPLSQEGVLVLGQGVDGSARQLLEALKSSRNVMLLGTSSFWEGVDVVGEALSLLVMARLPFAVPSDPVFAARSELFEDAFNEYALPQAVLRFKQGFGRLIRSRSDRGVMVALDRRLQSKRYGAVFLESLPQCTVKFGPARHLTQEVLAWL